MDYQPKPLVFTDDDLKPRECPVEIRGKQYLITELLEDDHATVMDAIMRARQMAPDGRAVVVEGLSRTKALLVRLSLREVIDDKGQRRLGKVAESFVNGLTDRIIDPIYKESKRLNNIDQPADLKALRKLRAEVDELIEGLEKEEGDAGKNGPPATAGTSS